MRLPLHLLPLLSVLAVGCLLADAPARAQEGSGERWDVEAPTPPPPVDDPRAELQELYRGLYEIQLQMARQEQTQARVDSLQRVRDGLLERIEALARRVERERARREIPPPPSAQGADDLSVLVGELERLGAEVDWESLSRDLERNAQSVGEGLAQIGEQLRELQIDVDEDRVRVDTGSGSRFTFTIPPELKEDISQGIKEMGRELSRVLDDSTREAFGGELRVLLDELPEDIGGREFWRGRRSREKKVIAESVFQAWKDFEVADDELVRGDVLIIGGDAYVAGEVQGNVYVVFGDLFVEGEGDVAEDAISLGGRVRVDDDSEVHGRRFDVSTILPGFGVAAWGGPGAGPWLLHSVRVATLALLLVLGFALAGRRLDTMVEHGQERLGRSLVSGALWFSITLGVFVVAAVGLAISVIGIPVVIVLTGAFALVILLAYFVGCQVVGERVLELFGGHLPARDWQIALVGMAILEIPALVAVVFASAAQGSEISTLLWILAYFVKFLALGIGFGSAVATRLGGPGNGIGPEATEHVPLTSDA